ncbi:MAG: hypothetical protein J2P28_18880, partial [Actinobacteria bacterium]|nr:hypothetical protein [Actinomycetota bacterium]
MHPAGDRPMTAERTTQHAPTAPATLARRRQPRLTRAWEAAVVRWRVIIEAAADRLQLQWLAVVEAVAAHGRRLQLQWGAITETVAGQVRQLPLRQWRAVIADALGRLHPRPLLLALVAGRDLERELSAVRAANVALQARALELERSNSELEQFAYMASHDLQEPLRKVASFCELLQRRYTGQLDERADQYIKFAVDGARRMQALVDDLLTFSRVGRLEPEPVLVSCASAASQAQMNLAAEIRATGAVIELDELPSVRAEFSLLTSVFQNLIGNAIKFRSDQPPVIRLSATRDEHFWL